MEPERSMKHSQGLFDIPYPVLNQFDTYFFKVHSYIVLLSKHRPL